MLPYYLVRKDLVLELERLGEECRPAEVGGEDAADGGGTHKHVHDDDLQLDGLQRRRAAHDEPRHGARQRDQPHRLGAVDHRRQRDHQRPLHLLQRRLPRRRAQSKRRLHLIDDSSMQKENYEQLRLTSIQHLLYVYHSW